MIVGALGAAMLVLAIPLGALFVLHRIERSYAGPCGHDEAASPRPVLDRTRVDEYESANLQLLAPVDSVLGPHGAPDRGLVPQCPTNTGHGGVVGVSTHVRYDVADGRTRCDVVRAVERALREHGWQVRSIETDIAGVGIVGSTDAWLGDAHLQVTVQTDRRSVDATIDHASDQPGRSLPNGIEPPCRD